MSESGIASLAGSVALVTGGSGGIGRSVASTLIAAGASVASVDLPGTTAVDGATPLDCDLRDAASIDKMFEAFRSRFDQLDLLVHCAGITRDSVLWKMAPEAWSEVLQVNLESAFHLLRCATPSLRIRGGGSVVLVSSINGQRGKFGQANYAASKAGLIGLGLSAARELGGFGVRVNIVAPGWIDTPMTRALPDAFRERALAETSLGRVGRPEDVANAVLFFASAMSRHVTGQVLRVDGGQLMG